MTSSKKTSRLLAGSLLALAALGGGCIPVDRALGVAAGDTSGVSYKQQYTVHDSFVVTAGYHMHGLKQDALGVEFDLVTFGRVPLAATGTTYVGFGLGYARWLDDSPSGNEQDVWLRAPIGMYRRFSRDTGEVFAEIAPTIGFGGFSPKLGFRIGIRRPFAKPPVAPSVF